jgi:alkylation response protein AidB-like acyl-CoA dehydrogenase
VRFDLTQEQSDFRNVVRTMLAREFPVDRLRACWDGAAPDLDLVWGRLVDLGLVAMAVPEKHGGLGGSSVEVALALEEAAYAGLPLPLVETAAVAAPLLAELAPDEVRDRWLPRVIRGEAKVSLAIDGSGFAVWGEDCAAVITVRGGELHLVPGDRIRWRRLDTEDPTRRLAYASFDELDAATILTRRPAAVARAYDLATAATAAQLVGIAQRMLDMARAYSLERRQFGQQIGSFQVLKHRMADMAVAIESARGLSWYAAYAATHEPGAAGLAARTAKAAASSACYQCGHGALQIHGGIGFTWEHDLHFWLKHGRALEMAYGTASDHRLAIGRAVLAELSSG